MVPRLCRLPAAAGFFALAAILASISASAVEGPEIGVVAHVDPAADLFRGDGRIDPAVGTELAQNDRLVTGEAGRLHLMLRDMSTLTVGAGSDIVLDRFAYDPAVAGGDFALSATRGVLRFVGGEVSKLQPVQIRTSVGTLGVRGGIALIRIFPDGAIEAVFGYGVSLSFVGRDGVETLGESVTRTGFRLTVDPAGRVTGLAPVTPDALGDLLGDLDAPTADRGTVVTPIDLDAAALEAEASARSAEGAISLADLVPALSPADVPALLDLVTVEDQAEVEITGGAFDFLGTAVEIEIETGATGRPNRVLEGDGDPVGATGPESKL